MKGEVNLMKSLDLTLTSKDKASIKRRGFIEPSLLSWGGDSTSADGSSFVNFAPAGAVQPKEVAIVNEGINLHTFNITFHSSIRKGITL